MTKADRLAMFRNDLPVVFVNKSATRLVAMNGHGYDDVLDRMPEGP